MKKKIIMMTFGLLSFTMYSQIKSNTVMVKSCETRGKYMGINEKIIVIEEKDKETTIELDRHNDDGIPKNMIKLKLILDKYLLDGYVIIDKDIFSHADGGIFLIEKTYIMQKTN